jgi:hypothetical protein
MEWGMSLPGAMLPLSGTGMFCALGAWDWLLTLDLFVLEAD